MAKKRNPRSSSAWSKRNRPVLFPGLRAVASWLEQLDRYRVRVGVYKIFYRIDAAKVVLLV
jgi:mRNA-degrading endonuclease RelE of RelBE toxin-antitoxin system